MIAYWKMLWQNRLAALRPSKQGQPGNQWLRRLGWAALGLLILAAYAGFVALEMLLYAVAEKIGDPEAVIVLAFFGCTMITLFYSFFTVVSQLFFGRDTAMLAALPIRSESVMFVKLLNIVLGESGIALMICAPVIIRYGTASSAGVGYYLRALMGILALPGIPVAVTVTLAFLLIRLSALWKRREGLTTVATFLFMGLIIAAEMLLTLNVEETEITAAVIGLLIGKSSVSRLVMGIYLPLEWLMKGLSGWNDALLFAGLSAAAVGLTIAVFGRSYMALTIRQSETRRRENAAARKDGRRLRERSPLRALYDQEMKEVITVPSYATNCLSGVVMFPVLMIVMFVAAKTEQSGQTLKLLSGLLNPALYLAAAAGFLSLTCTTNMAVATAVSREGTRHELRRTYPIPGRVHLCAKLLMGLSYNALAALGCAVVLMVIFPDFWLETLAALLISQLFSLLWSMLGLLIDVCRPKFNWKNETEAVKQSTNSLLGMLAGLGMLVVLAGLVLLCLQFGLPVWTGIAADVTAMAFCCLVLWKWLMSSGARMYSFKEFSNL